MNVGTLSLAALLLAPQKTTDAEEALRRSMERRMSANVDAIVDQLTPWGHGYTKLRMRRDTAGRRRTEVLAPMEMQGQLSVDDGTTWTTYFPGNRAIRVHPSPLVEADDVEFRMRLIHQNYRLEIDSKPVVAGRQTLRIVAHPRSPEMETRRFYLDAATFVPLKMDMVNELGGVTVQFAMRRVEFPTRFEKSTFEAPSVTGARPDPATPPQPLRGASDAERRVGFRPAMPRRLPFGFRQQNVSLLDWRGVTPVAIRLTDGLVRMNVYQFRIGNKPPRKPRPGDDGRVSQDVGDLRIEVHGDGPRTARERVLSVYAAWLTRSVKP